MRQILLATFMAAGWAGTASAACTYEQVEPVAKQGQMQHRFFSECGFYEVGYMLEGNTLHFPRGGTHTVSDVSVAEAQSLLTETYGLVDVGDDTFIRTKGLFGPSR